MINSIMRNFIFEIDSENIQKLSKLKLKLKTRT